MEYAKDFKAFEKFYEELAEKAENQEFSHTLKEPRLIEYWNNK